MNSDREQLENWSLKVNSERKIRLLVRAIQPDYIWGRVK